MNELSETNHTAWFAGNGICFVKYVNREITTAVDPTVLRKTKPSFQRKKDEKQNRQVWSLEFGHDEI